MSKSLEKGRAYQLFISSFQKQIDALKAQDEQQAQAFMNMARAMFNAGWDSAYAQVRKDLG